MSLPQDVPLALDDRRIEQGTGVTSYARALAEAQRRLSDFTLVVRDTQLPPARMLSRWQRRARALWPGPVAMSKVDGALQAPDLFRLAQVYFDVHGRLLTLKPPLPHGIVHWSYPVPLQIRGWRNVYTIHDAIPLSAPELTAISPSRHRRLLRRIVASADALVTVTEAARTEIATALAISPTRLVNCSQSISLDALRQTLPAGLPSGGYLLAVGTVEPRKNVARLIAAHRLSKVALPMVIAGPVGSGDGAIALEREIASSDRIIRLNYVSPPEMASLIAQARVLVMPSLAEGFGLPVAEAMSLGTPVITSDRGALAETAGGAAALINPTDTAALAAAMRRLVESDMELARLARSGTENARRFTVSAFAERLRPLYQALLPARAT